MPNFTVGKISQQPQNLSFAFETLDATPQVAGRYSPGGVGSAALGDIRVVAITADGLKCATWALRVVSTLFINGVNTFLDIRNGGGGPDADSDASMATCQFNAVANANEVQFQVTGLVGTPIRWKLNFNYLEIDV